MKNNVIKDTLLFNRAAINKNVMAFKILPYILTFTLFLGYSVATSSSVTPLYIFDKENISMYGFGDLFYKIYEQNTIIIMFLISYFLNYKSYQRNNSSLFTSRILFKKLTNVAICLIVIYTSVFIAYILTCDIKTFNLGFSDRSALRYILPAHWAILLSFVFSLFYLLAFSLITSIIEKQTSKSWLSVLISIAIAYVDIGIRFGFQSKELIGILLSDNVSVFYLESIFYGINRPSYFYSFMYWIILITALCFVWFLLNKKNRIAGDNQ